MINEVNDYPTYSYLVAHAQKQQKGKQNNNYLKVVMSDKRWRVDCMIIADI